MNILFITHADNYYGSSKSLISLLDGLSIYGINAHVIVSKESGFTKALAQRNIPYQIIPMNWWMSNKRISLYEKLKYLSLHNKSSKAIQKYINSNKIDLVYTNSSVIPDGFFAAMLKKRPHIWHIREFGDLDFSLRYIFSKRLSLKMVQHSDAVICNAVAVKDHLFPTKKNDIHVVYNGSATQEQFESYLGVKGSQKNSGEFVFSMVSLISPKKGQETAIKAVSELKKRGLLVKLVIAGHGKSEYVQTCQKLVNDLGISSQVEFLGFIENPYDIYFSSDCVLVCSDFEALSRVALEAMSCCVPVIAKNSGGTPEIIQHGDNGLLYNSFDDLVAGMINMVNNTTYRNQLAYNGWLVAKTKFNIENYAENVYRVIQSVIRSAKE